MAAFVLAVGLMAAAAFIGNAMASTSRSEYMTQAATLVSEKLEDLNRWPAADPNVAVTNGTSAGSLTSDLVQDVTANGTTEAVNYYDEVFFSPSQGSLEEIVSSLDANGNPQYTTISHPATGIILDPPPPPRRHGRMWRERSASNAGGSSNSIPRLRERKSTGFGGSRCR